MTGGESSHKDVDASVVGLILFEVGVDHFEGVFIGESDLSYVDEWVGDEGEELVCMVDDFCGGFVYIFTELAPEAVKHEFSSGFTPWVLDDEVGIEVDTFFLLV